MAVASRNCHHFLAQLSRGEMVELGEFGDEYLAQQSLRTLTKRQPSRAVDIKLPLTIYNTSLLSRHSGQIHCRRAAGLTLAAAAVRL